MMTFLGVLRFRKEALFARAGFGNRVAAQVRTHRIELRALVVQRDGSDVSGLFSIGR